MKPDQAGSRQVRQQYERFPYPPLPWPALPRRDQGAALRYETGRALATGQTDRSSHQGIRILVAGCGTLEALVVAQNHPQAAEVVAVDLSAASLSILRRRLRWARLRNIYTLAGLRGHRLPPVRLVQADLHTYADGRFDYILANNVLHHVTDPAALLGQLASRLEDDGLMRVVTYPRHSRYWLRQTGAWLRQCGLGPQTEGLKQKAAACIKQLPPGHPIRNGFEAHSETGHVSGLVDAFLHALENPLSPLAWRDAAARAGLALIGEAQHPDAQSGFLSELAPATAGLDAWTRSQILDDLLELNTNPVWWFRKGRVNPTPNIAPAVRPAFDKPAASIPADCLSRDLEPATVADIVRNNPSQPWSLPSRTYLDLGGAVHDAAALLQGTGLSIEDLIDALRREVGPHLDSQGKPLQGLSIGEYDTQALLKAVTPWRDEDWQALQQQIGNDACLHLDGENVPGETLTEQARWLQLRYGPEQALIGPLQFAKT